MTPLSTPSPVKRIGWLRNLFRLIRFYRRCPLCGNRGVHTILDNPIHPDGVPIFIWSECIDCDASSEIEGTGPFNRATKIHGYRDFITFLEKKMEMHRDE